MHAEEGSLIKKVALVAVLVFVSVSSVSITALAGSVYSTFSCTTTDDNGTMTHYSYFKEPGLDESSYSRGYKMGSINYLANGNIDFKDYFGYYDGQMDEGHSDPTVDYNSTIYHYQIVNFTGEKGISEIYAKGFYPNNRAVSAWKKIRYDDLEYVKYGGVLHLSGAPRVQGIGRSPIYSGTYNLGESHKSSRIYVEAYADMGNTVGMDGEGQFVRYGSHDDYSFKYKANVTDGIIEIRDATGWTNKSASTRIDWEQDALIQGDNISIVNNLIAQNMSYPAAGPEEEDWLGCCIGGGYDYKQDIERDKDALDGYYCDDEEKCNIDYKADTWPSSSIYNTLKPYPKLPNLTLSKECFIDPITGILRCTDPPAYDVFNCNHTKCEGFECIYQFPSADRTEEPSEDGGDGSESQNQPSSKEHKELGNKSSSLDVILSHKLSEDFDENGDVAPYEITVTSKRDLRNVTLYDEYPNGFEFIDSYPDANSSSPKVIWENLKLEAGKSLSVTVNFTHNIDIKTPDKQFWDILKSANAYATWYDNGPNDRKI